MHLLQLTTSDVRQNKLMAYRRTLTKVVKLKTHLLNATVKVTCSRDGKEVEWYKGHSQEGGKAKPVGSLPVEKVRETLTSLCFTGLGFSSQVPS